MHIEMNLKKERGTIFCIGDIVNSVFFFSVERYERDHGRWFKPGRTYNLTTAGLSACTGKYHILAHTRKRKVARMK